MAESYTTDNRVQRIVSVEELVTEEATDGSYPSLAHTHNLGYEAYNRFYTQYQDGSVVIGAPYAHYPVYLGVQITYSTSATTYQLENLTNNSTVKIYSRIYTEVLDG